MNPRFALVLLVLLFLGLGALGYQLLSDLVWMELPRFLLVRLVDFIVARRPANAEEVVEGDVRSFIGN